MRDVTSLRILACFHSTRDHLPLGQRIPISQQLHDDSAIRERSAFSAQINRISRWPSGSSGWSQSGEHRCFACVAGSLAITSVPRKRCGRTGFTPDQWNRSCQLESQQRSDLCFDLDIAPALAAGNTSLTLSA